MYVADYNEVKRKLHMILQKLLYFIRILGDSNLNMFAYKRKCVTFAELFFLYITFKTKQWSVGALYFTLCW